MDGGLLFLLGVAFLASSSLYLLFSKRRRQIVLERLNLHRRRTSGARTPPRSLSPEKEASPLEPADVDYRDVFPPSRRFTLAACAPDIVQHFAKPDGGLLQAA